MYNVHMSMSASEFRKDLFRILEKVIGGETVEIAYKGSTLRVAAASSGSKLARVKRRHALLCDPDELVKSDPKLMAEFERKWRKDWHKL